MIKEIEGIQFYKKVPDYAGKNDPINKYSLVLVFIAALMFVSTQLIVHAY